ncbi:Uncharacterised protein [Vibrio cholerae]|nr:Uncharacterised protein [Vibrio cholerae]
MKVHYADVVSEVVLSPWLQVTRFKKRAKPLLPRQ